MQQGAKIITNLTLVAETAIPFSEYPKSNQMKSYSI